MKMRLLTPDEVVERSCAIAEKLVDRLLASGGLVELQAPAPDAKKDDE